MSQRPVIAALDVAQGAAVIVEVLIRDGGSGGLIVAMPGCRKRTWKGKRRMGVQRPPNACSGLVRESGRWPRYRRTHRTPRRADAGAGTGSTRFCGPKPRNACSRSCSVNEHSVRPGKRRLRSSAFWPSTPSERRGRKAGPHSQMETFCGLSRKLVLRCCCPPTTVSRIGKISQAERSPLW